jgi:hypothetical protein
MCIAVLKMGTEASEYFISKRKPGQLSVERWSYRAISYSVPCYFLFDMKSAFSINSVLLSKLREKWKSLAVFSLQ